MKNYLVILLLITIIPAYSLTGCASYSVTMRDIFGISRADLEKARKTGFKKDIPVPMNEAFDKVTQIANNDKLVIYQETWDKKYMVLMGFPRQTDTTRVGIFFDKIDDKSTAITISSMSSTALARAKEMILDKLQ